MLRYSHLCSQMYFHKAPIIFSPFKMAQKKPKTDSSTLGFIHFLNRTQLRLEKLCIQLCHQECYFVHDGFLLSLCCSNFTTDFCACQRFFEDC